MPAEGTAKKATVGKADPKLSTEPDEECGFTASKEHAPVGCSPWSLFLIKIKL